MFQRKHALPYRIITMKSSLLFLLLFLCTVPFFAQNRDALEKERMLIIEEIVSSDKLLKKTKKEKDTALDELNIIEKQIEKRTALVENIKKQLESTDTEIKLFQVQIDSLNLKISEYKKQYSNFLRLRYLQKKTSSPWESLFNFKNVNQAFKNWLHAKQLGRWTEQKQQEIEVTNQNLQSSIDQIENSRSDKTNLLKSEQEQFILLENEKKAKKEVIQSIKENENKYTKILKTKKKEREKLNDAIEEYIIKQFESKSTTTVSAPPKVNVKTSKEKVIAANFAQSKGILPWPVNGYISSKFGKRKHPTIKKVTISNNGIDIKTSTNAQVKCVMKGTVIGITQIPGFNNMVVIQHGEYYSVYSKLNNVYVQSGDIIMSGEVIGEVYNNEGVSELHFEIWKNKTKLDPSHWLKRK